MKIEIIVPVIVDYLFYGLLESIESNSLLPTRILLIDNTLNGVRPKSNKIEVVRLKSKTGKVNESWNIGIKNTSKHCDAVGIYNDDIVLNSYFFQRVKETLISNGVCGVACPETVDVSKSLKRGKVNRIRMRHREGWCFTFKKQVLDLMPPIPDNRLIQFHGDDFFWYHTHRLGYFWGKDLGNPIWHYKGISILETGERIRKRPDYWAWQEIKAQIK